MGSVSTLKLHNFRCYSSAVFDELDSGLLVLHGVNGAGKTNVLEAVSLLSPGRGLRGARVNEILRTPHPNPLLKEREHDVWAVSATIQQRFGSVQIGTGMEPGKKTRTVRINGQNARGQNALAEHVACVWLTPQMDRLFLDSSRERRKFLDRLVFTFDPGHSGRVIRYENAMRQRSKLLQEGKGDPAWLKGLEAQMAETGAAIAAARLDFVERLQAACIKAGAQQFPLAHLYVRGTIEELLQNTSALEVEELFRYQLSESRGVDMLTGGAATGPHKSDLVVSMEETGMAADQCSTGEQKALLIGIVMAHARLIAAERGAAPILLLDEVAAHLDEGRRAALYELLIDLGGQVWLTGTECALFNAIRGKAQFFEIADAAVKAA